MKKYFLAITLLLFIVQPVNAWSIQSFNIHSDERAVKRLLNSQIKYANKANFDKFISTYDESYVNADGFNYNTYSKLVKETWGTFSNIKYGIDIKEVIVDNDNATVKLYEKSYAKLDAPSEKLDGILKSISDSVYCLKKIDGKWKVVSDKVIDETTSMMYGDAINLDVNLLVPNEVSADTEYSAALEFIPPNETIAIASIASDLVEYPQKPTKEVFRVMPEDNILERLFTANNQNLNEYIVASIGLTKTEICDISVKMSLTGYGYKIKRVNIIPAKEEYLDDENK